MAKHSRGALKVLRCSAALTLGALADNTVVIVDVSGSDFDREMFLLSAKITSSLRNLTAGEGPIHVGFAHSDYTAAEINEWFNANNFLSADKVEQEQGRRLCRDIGVFNGLSTEESLADGRPMSTKLRFLAQEGANLTYWARNSSGATLTTGGIIEFNGKIFAKGA